MSEIKKTKNLDELREGDSFYIYSEAKKELKKCVIKEFKKNGAHAYYTDKDFVRILVSCCKCNRGYSHRIVNGYAEKTDDIIIGVTAADINRFMTKIITREDTELKKAVELNQKKLSDFHKASYEMMAGEE